MRKDARTLELVLDRDAETPLWRQLYHGLRRRILEGRLPLGSRLPSTRILAGELGISRNTVLTAYDQLVAEGYLEGKRGAGTRVALDIPLREFRERSARRPSSRAPPRLSTRCQAVLGLPRAIPSLAGTRLAFAVGVPALDAFPVNLWGRLARRAGTRLAARTRDGLDPAGYYPLREAITNHLAAARGIICGPEQIVVVQGIQHALFIASHALLDPGEVACVEDPGYPGVWGALSAAGLRIVPVPVDREGIDVEDIKALPQPPRAIFVSPSHQFPLGIRMSLARRLALLTLAEESGAWIVEDDYDSEFRYRGQPVMALRALDEGSRVIYVGGFSKTIAPTLRVGYAVLPDPLVEPFLSFRLRTDLHPPLLEQLVLAEFMSGGHFARHLRAMRRLYAERRDHLVYAAGRQLSRLLELQPDDTGLRLVGYLPDGVDDRRAAAAAEREGVETLPLSRFYRNGPAQHGLVLGFAATDERAIGTGVERLARALQSLSR